MQWWSGIVRWARTVPPLVQDGLLALALFGVAATEVRLGFGPANQSQRWPAVFLLALESVVIVPRRRHPIPVWLVSGLLAAVYAIAPFPDPALPYAPLVAVYTVAAATSLRTALWAGAATVAVVLATLAADTHADSADWILATFAVSSAWLIGTNVRTHRAYTAELEARAAALEREREEQARRAAAAERLRLARELHDVAAHQVSVIALHAEAGEALAPIDPERAGAAFHTIGDAARATLIELRRTLGVLRDDPEAGAAGAGPADGAGPGAGPGAAGADRAPVPTLGQLPALVDNVQRAGLPVVVTVEGRPQRVDAGVESSAYRIVQEALTNVLRHAGPASARVHVRYEPDAIAVEVVDNGRGGPADGPGAGLGLVGMRERVASFGGFVLGRPLSGRRLRRTSPPAGLSARRVLVVDDQELVRAGLRAILEVSGIEVVGEAGTGAEAVAQASALRPDVVLMDVRMPVLDGIEATRQIRGAGDDAPRVLVLTTFDLDEYVFEALRAGASGFLLKDSPRAELVRAIEVIAAGDALLAPSVTRRLVADFTRRRGAAAPRSTRELESLTPRERDVLVLVARGLTNSEIAAQLIVGEATVKTHLGHVLMKLALRDRVQAVILAYELGLVTPGETPLPPG